jgi:cbb3-type cytochrome oxidase subunit 3
VNGSIYVHMYRKGKRKERETEKDRISEKKE